MPHPTPGLWLYIRDEANGGALVSFVGPEPVWAEVYISPGAPAADFAARLRWRRIQGSITVSERPGCLAGEGV